MTRNILARIKGVVNNMSDEEFMALPGFYELIRSQITSVLRRGERVDIEFESTKSQTTAYTDGYIIHCNTWSPLVLPLETRYLKYLSNIGSASHECGHVLYTDFALLGDIREKMAYGYYSFKGSNELYKRDERVKNYFVNEMFDIVNIVEDMYIESRLAMEYPKEGILVKGLDVGNKVKYDLSPSLIKLESAVDMGNLLLPSLFVSMLQIRNCLGYDMKDEELCSGPTHKKLMEALKSVDGVVEDYKNDHRRIRAERNIRTIVEVAYSLLPPDEAIFTEPDPKGETPDENSKEGKCSGGCQNQDGQDEGESNSSSSNGDNENGENKGNGKKSRDTTDENNRGDDDEDDEGYDDDKDGTDDDSDKESENSSGSNHGRELSEAEKDKKMKKISSGSQDLKKECGMSDRNDKTMERATKRPQRGSVEREDEEENKEISSDKDLNKEIEKIMAEMINKEFDKKNSDKNIKEVMEKFFKGSFYAISNMDVQAQSGNKYSYNEEYKEIKKTSLSCQRLINQILNKKNDDEFDSGHMMGSKFNVGDYYHKDGKYFSKQVIPDDVPDLVASILVDGSGSMHGKKIVEARKAAILFDDICRGLKISHNVSSHTSSWSEVQISNFVDFNSPEKDKYLISNIIADSGNVDVMAISVKANELLKRKEKTKLLIVISDGEPCSDGTPRSENFMGVPLKHDTSMDYEDLKLNACIRYWRKKGINIVGISIDEVEKIKKIYERDILDCTQLDKLPSAMAKLFRRFVVNK